MGLGNLARPLKDPPPGPYTILCTARPPMDRPHHTHSQTPTPFCVPLLAGDPQAVGLIFLINPAAGRGGSLISHPPSVSPVMEFRPRPHDGTGSNEANEGNGERVWHPTPPSRHTQPPPLTKLPLDT